MVRPMRRRGFTLLEILIALLIASIGLLGIAGLVQHSLRASFESGIQTTAALLAIDIHERAWLEAHLPKYSPPDGEAMPPCNADGSWIRLSEFSPTINLDELGLAASFPQDVVFPTCELTISWGPSTGGVFGGIAGFGGTYTHRFRIPSVVAAPE